ncbi:hypothetical protein BB561_003215 [Smittium simulii]|uniref:RlpA-like protein double-psi beta-barrel domain-containing protein n=1 Tax=Smittium simulii TaxID=133385 RepID=A0A2T9YMI2_9FUNG|nr:hypothetical protein BB561_003215 [Smittium simulii]
MLNKTLYTFVCLFSLSALAAPQYPVLKENEQDSHKVVTAYRCRTRAVSPPVYQTTTPTTPVYQTTSSTTPVYHTTSSTTPAYQTTTSAYAGAAPKNIQDNIIVIPTTSSTSKSSVSTSSEGTTTITIVRTIEIFNDEPITTSTPDAAKKSDRDINVESKTTTAVAVAQPSAQTAAPSAGTFSGQATYYEPGLGSCGITNSDSEAVAAISAEQYGGGANPNNSPVCGKCVLVNGPNNTSIKVKIVDKCPTCKSGDLDLSSSAFKALSPLDPGRISITWSFVSC